MMDDISGMLNAANSRLSQTVYTRLQLDKYFETDYNEVVEVKDHNIYTSFDALHSFVEQWWLVTNIIEITNK